MGVVAVPREVDEAGEVATVGVRPHEEAQLPPFPGVQHRLRDRDQLVQRRLEQLVPRVGLEHVHERLAGVAHRVCTGRLDHRVGLLAHHRDAGQRLRVGGGAEEPEEAPLPHDLAGLVERLDADVVEVDGPVDGRLGVRLREDQQRLLARLGLDQGRQLPERRREVLVGTEDPEAGAGDGAEHLVALDVVEAVLPVAQEGEVVVGEPAQQRLALLDLGLRERRRVLLQVLDDDVDLLLHLRPVLDGLTHVAEHLAEGVLDDRQLRRVALPVDLHVDPRLAGDVRLGADDVALVVDGLQQLAGHVTPDEQLRVDDHVDAAALLVELHRHGVDEERHVVGDDLDDGVAPGRPAVLGHGRGEGADLRGALGAVAGQPVVAQRRAVDVHLGPLDQVLDRHVAVVLADELGCGIAGRAPAASARGGHGRHLRDHVVPVGLLRRQRSSSNPGTPLCR